MAFTCPTCSRVSHNPNDMREGYCGHCHAWTGAPDNTMARSIDELHLAVREFADHVGAAMTRLFARIGR